MRVRKLTRLHNADLRITPSICGDVYALRMMFVAAFALAAAVTAPAQLDALVTSALAGDASARAALRAAGQPAVDALIARDAPAALVDAVAAQHDARSSRLYWHTDLAAARAEGARTKKPILSLRMLGDLDKELSCANSRFFRGLLYADPSVSQVLREKFVLHWQSVRPVPVVTVDMGDGRKFTTTITGNSAHLVLDANGAPVDAIPGMYGPQAFLAALDRAHVAATSCKTRECVATVHARAKDALDASWTRDMRALGRSAPSPAATARAEKEDAEAIANRAMAKAVVERPLLRKLDGATGANDVKDESLQREVARLHARNIKWDGPALARFTATRSQSFSNKLREEVSVDTVQNEQQHHRAIHEWFARNDIITHDEAALTKAIYDTVFATPSTDPWLGLGDVRDGAVVR